MSNWIGGWKRFEDLLNYPLIRITTSDAIVLKAMQPFTNKVNGSCQKYKGLYWCFYKKMYITTTTDWCRMNYFLIGIIMYFIIYLICIYIYLKKVLKILAIKPGKSSIVIICTPYQPNADTVFHIQNIIVYLTKSSMRYQHVGKQKFPIKLIIFQCYHYVWIYH